jgi:hypothetical protein
MNLEHRKKFKQIKTIENLGSTLKGDELLITLNDDRRVKVFGNTRCITANRFGEMEEILAKELTNDYAIKIDQFVDQL